MMVNKTKWRKVLDFHFDRLLNLEDNFILDRFTFIMMWQLLESEISSTISYLISSNQINAHFRNKTNKELHQAIWPLTII